MALTAQQLVTLRANIDATPALAALPNNSDGAFEIAAYYQQPHPTPFLVWKDSVSVDEVMANGFDWTRVDNATVSKARIWEWMMRQGTINPSKANIRAGVNNAWSGGANDAHRLAIFQHCQVQATRGQQLFATGAGTTTTHDGVGPATTALTAPISLDDVLAARSLE